MRKKHIQKPLTFYFILHFTLFCFGITKIEAKYTNTLQKNYIHLLIQHTIQIVLYLFVQRYSMEKEVRTKYWMRLKCAINDEVEEEDNLPMIHTDIFFSLFTSVGLYFAEPLQSYYSREKTLFHL